MANNDITFEIIKHYGVISSENSGWTRELNMVAWNHGEPKFDIRSWDENHTRMTRGITMTNDEAVNLVKLLKNAV